MLSGVAYAEDPLAPAEQAFQSAKRHIEQGRYDAALTDLNDAYSMVPAPALLFDIAQCHRALEEWDEAIRFYQSFLEQTKDRTEREATEEMIAECKTRLGQPKSIDLFGPEEKILVLEPNFAAAPVTPPPAKIEETREIAAEPATVPRATPEIAAAPQPIAAPEVAVEEEPAIYERWWFWTAVGGAVAIVVAGTAIGLTSGDDVVLPSGSAGTIDLR
jgi:tetratricopeptide (TPR) repeat protein